MDHIGKCNIDESLIDKPDKNKWYITYHYFL